MPTLRRKSLTFHAPDEFGDGALCQLGIPLHQMSVPDSLFFQGGRTIMLQGSVDAHFTLDNLQFPCLGNQIEGYAIGEVEFYFFERVRVVLDQREFSAQAAQRLPRQRTSGSLCFPLDAFAEVYEPLLVPT